MHVQRYSKLSTNTYIDKKPEDVKLFYPEKDEFVDDLILMLDHIFSYEFKTFSNIDEKINIKQKYDS